MRIIIIVLYYCKTEKEIPDFVIIIGNLPTWFPRKSFITRKYLQVGLKIYISGSNFVKKSKYRFRYLQWKHISLYSCWVNNAIIFIDVKFPI